MSPPTGTCHLLLLLGLVSLTAPWPTAGINDFSSAIDPPMAATTPGNSSNVSGPAPQTMELSRKIATPLALLMFFLVVTTYWILARYTHELSNDIWLPSGCLEPNITAILSTTWPKAYTKTPVKESPQDWLLFFPNNDENACGRYKVEGHGEVPEIFINPKCNKRPTPSDDVENGTTPQPQSLLLRVRTSSPIMNTLVQISIWSSVSCWLILAMVANTLIYNGFVNQRTTDDSIIRLVLVLFYALANFAFQCHASTLLYRNFTFLIFQTCWKLVLSTFVSVSTNAPQGSVKLQEDWINLNLELFGDVRKATTYRVESAEEGLLTISKNVDENNDRCKSRTDVLSLLNTQRESEIKAYEKSAESALAKTLANVAVMLGICLATGLASWTSTEKGDSTAAQLGSYALLLSISTGLIAVINIHSELANATESASSLLLVLEKIIGAVLKYEREGFSPRDMPKIGFSEGVDSKPFSEKRCLTPCGLWRLASPRQWLPCVLFGPALLFIPWHRGNYTKNEIDKEEKTELNLNVNKAKLRFFPGCGLIRRSTEATTAERDPSNG